MFRFVSGSAVVGAMTAALMIAGPAWAGEVTQPGLDQPALVGATGAFWTPGGGDAVAVPTGLFSGSGSAGGAMPSLSLSMASGGAQPLPLQLDDLNYNMGGADVPMSQPPNAARAVTAGFSAGRASGTPGSVGTAGAIQMASDSLSMGGVASPASDSVTLTPAGPNTPIAGSDPPASTLTDGSIDPPNTGSGGDGVIRTVPTPSAVAAGLMLLVFAGFWMGLARRRRA